MTNELQEVKDLFEQIDQRIKQLEEKCKEEDDKWPKLGDTFYSIDWTGEVIEVEWGGFHCSERMGEQLLEIGNVYKTREEAEFMVEKLKVIKELKELARPFEPNEHNFSVCYDYRARGLGTLVYNVTHSAYGDFYFSNQIEAEQAVEEIGKERIKKYLFGVE